MDKKIICIIGPACCDKISVANLLHDRYNYGVIKPISDNKLYGSTIDDVIDFFNEHDTVVQVTDVRGFLDFSKYVQNNDVNIKCYGVYIEPNFDYYEYTLKSKDFLKQILKEEEEMREELELYYYNSNSDIDNIFFVSNDYSTEKLAATINLIMLLNNNYETIKYDLLKLQPTSTISCKPKHIDKRCGDLTGFITLVDYYDRSVKHTMCVNINRDGRLTDYLLSMFSNNISIYDDNYIEIDLSSEYGIYLIGENYDQKKIY